MFGSHYLHNCTSKLARGRVRDEILRRGLSIDRKSRIVCVIYIIKCYITLVIIRGNINEEIKAGCS